MNEKLMLGPGTIYIYPETTEGKPVKMEDVEVLEWPSVQNNQSITFLFTEPNIGRQIGRTSMPHLYVERYRGQKAVTQ